MTEFFACELGGGIYVFLFELNSQKEDVDRFVWVICGNVPPLYLTTDCCPTPKSVAETYCDLAVQWCDGTLPELDFSVRDVPDNDVKSELRRRITSLKKSIRLHSFKPYDKIAELSDNPNRRLDQEFCDSHIILRAERLAEDLRFSTIHDATAICEMAIPLFELAEEIKVRKLNVIHYEDTTFATNSTVEELHWTTNPMPDSLDFSPFLNLRRLSIGVDKPARVRIVAPQLDEVTFCCKQGGCKWIFHHLNICVA